MRGAFSLLRRQARVRTINTGLLILSRRPVPASVFENKFPKPVESIFLLVDNVQRHIASIIPRDEDFAFQVQNVNRRSVNHISIRLDLKRSEFKLTVFFLCLLIICVSSLCFFEQKENGI